jgi:hypothetical protein
MQEFLQQFRMGRPARIFDEHLHEALRSYMKMYGRTVTEVAAMVSADKGTISRALSTRTFSRSLATRIASLIAPTTDAMSVKVLLQKSLHLLTMSDRLRRDAERMLSQALDLTTQTK